VIEFVKIHPLPDAQEFCGALLLALGYSHPEILLSRFVDLVYKEAISNGALRKGKNTSELSWYARESVCVWVVYFRSVVTTFASHYHPASCPVGSCISCRTP
jgi:hypothetical protein